MGGLSFNEIFIMNKNKLKESVKESLQNALPEIEASLKDAIKDNMVGKPPWKERLLYALLGILVGLASTFLGSCSYVERIERNADGSYSYDGGDFIISIDRKAGK